MANKEKRPVGSARSICQKVLGSVSAALLVILLTAPPVWAICAVIPWLLTFFESEFGQVSRPFVGPGETFEITIDNEHATSEFVVTFVSPQRDGSTLRHVLAAEGALDTGACPDGQVQQWHLASIGSDGLQDMEQVDRDETSLLRLRLPEEIPAGPLLVSVSTANSGEPVACNLEQVPCDQGNVACIGSLKDPGGSTPYLSKHFMALPVANDFAQKCVQDDVDSSSPCSQAPGEISESILRAVVDTDGNVLLPVAWDGILTQQNSLYARVVEGRIRWPFESPPAKSSLRSLSTMGLQMPPLFEPHADENPSDGYSIAIAGTADASASVLRVASRLGTCEVSGDRCELDGDCEGEQSCTDVKALFSLPAGPLNLPNNPGTEPGGNQADRGFCLNRPDKICDESTPCETAEGECQTFDFQLSAEETVALAGILGTDEVIILARSDCGEEPEGTCEEDEQSWSLSVRERSTWRSSNPQIAVTGYLAYQCGLTPNSSRPVERVMLFEQSISSNTFIYPAVAAENRVVAFVESEEGIACGASANAPGCQPQEEGCDVNGDGDRNDGILRVFRIDANGDAVDLVGQHGEPCSKAPLGETCQGASALNSNTLVERQVQGATLIDGKPLVISDGKVWSSNSQTSTLVVFDTNEAYPAWTPVSGNTPIASVAGPDIAFSTVPVFFEKPKEESPALDATAQDWKASVSPDSFVSDGNDLDLLFLTTPSWSTDPSVNDVIYFGTPGHIRLQPPWVLLNYHYTPYAEKDLGSDLFNVGAIQYLEPGGTNTCSGPLPCPRETFLEAHEVALGATPQPTEISGDHILQKEVEGMPGSDYFVLVGLDRMSTSPMTYRWALPEYQGGQHALAGGTVSCGDTTLDVFAIEWNEAASLAACTGQNQMPIPCACTDTQVLGDCNGDGDVEDNVIGIVLAPRSSTGLSGPLPVIQTGYAARPCDEPTCDPEKPYRFDGSRILFLSNEMDQGSDLDGNGALEDQNVVIKIDFCPGEEAVNSETVVAEVLGPVDPDSTTTSDPLSIDGDTVAVASNYGRCALDALTQDCTLPGAESCSPHACDGTSKRCVLTNLGACRLGQSDCPSGTTCVPSHVTTVDSIQDSDGDGLRDTVDPPSSEGCAPTPLSGCRAAIGTKKSNLKILAATNPNRSRVSWRWSGGEATSLEDFGNPISSHDYEFCLYDGNGALAMNLSTPSGERCGTGRRNVDCWRTSRGTPWTYGFGYRNPAGVPNGARWARLKPGNAGKARAEIRGAGALLELPDLNALQAPLRAQFQGENGTCLESNFTDFNLKSSSRGQQLKAVSD